MGKHPKIGISSCKRNSPTDFKFKLSRAAIESDIRKIRALEAEISLPDKVVSGTQKPTFV
jgi:hypothetical protein